MSSSDDVNGDANSLLFKLYNLNSKRGTFISIEDIFKKLSDNSHEEKENITYLINDVLTKEFKYLEQFYQGHTPQYRYKITPKGFAYINESKNTLVPSNNVFCAMWFDPSTNGIWEKGIAPAIEKAGFDPIRIDKEHFTEDVIAEMLIRINRSKFVLADLTGHRTAVYYEAGYAQAKGLKVIFTCKKDDEKGINFDVNHYPIIFWDEDSIDLFEHELYSRIIKITA